MDEARALGRRSSLPLPSFSSSPPASARAFFAAGALSSPDDSVSESPAPPFSPFLSPSAFAAGRSGPPSSESSVSESPAPDFGGAATPVCCPPWGGGGASWSSSSPS